MAYRTILAITEDSAEGPMFMTSRGVHGDALYCDLDGLCEQLHAGAVRPTANAVARWLRFNAQPKRDADTNPAYVLASSAELEKDDYDRICVIGADRGAWRQIELGAHEILDEISQALWYAEQQAKAESAPEFTPTTNDYVDPDAWLATLRASKHEAALNAVDDEYNSLDPLNGPIHPKRRKRPSSGSRLAA